MCAKRWQNREAATDRTITGVIINVSIRFKVPPETGIKYVTITQRLPGTIRSQVRPNFTLGYRTVFGSSFTAG
jgi:hypothetical protein